MSDLRGRAVINADDHLEVGPGRSFAFVSGLGRRNIREQLGGGDWWASVWSSTRGTAHGAPFCTFDGATGDCRFKDVTGAIPDRFTLESRNAPGARAEPAAASDASAYEEPASAPTLSRVSGGATDPLSWTVGLLAAIDAWVTAHPTFACITVLALALSESIPVIGVFMSRTAAILAIAALDERAPFTMSDLRVEN